MAKMGRPKIELDKEEFEKLCEIQCTKEEMANWFNISPDTVENFCKAEYSKTFSAAYKRFSSGGKMSLRRQMFRKAIERDNTAMQIWLSKQHLGMSDKSEIKEDEEKKSDFTPITKEIVQEIVTRFAGKNVPKK